EPNSKCWRQQPDSTNTATGTGYRLVIVYLFREYKEGIPIRILSFSWCAEHANLLGGESVLWVGFRP
ncbi:MAG: hypothetical protein ACK5MG_07495, partial [Bacteroidales bacterium]